MFRMMSTSFSAAAFVGIGAAYATAMVAGPLASIGFVAGSCIGYVACSMYCMCQNPYLRNMS